MPAPIALAAACCDWPPSAEGAGRARAAAARIEDWERFDGVVRRNRISPLAHRALQDAGCELPDWLQESLSVRSRAAARRSLVMARESMRLQQMFEAEGIASMIVKGSPLAMLAYGELAVKEAADIDLLVAPEDIVQARRLLLSLDYEMLPHMEEKRFIRFAEHDKEAVFHLAEGHITTELHWRLVKHRNLLRGVDVRSPDQLASLPGGTLRTLADEPLFAFLCLHGAFHNWSRLKWLADINAFLSARPPSEVERLYEAARALGAHRSAAVAMLLCRWLFGRSLHPALLDSLERDRMVRALADNVVAGLCCRDGTVEPGTYSMPWLRMRVAQFFVAPGASHMLDQARVAWISPADRSLIPLPRSLAFAYHLIRLPLWFGRTCRSIFMRKRNQAGD